MKAPYGCIVKALENPAGKASFARNQQLSTRFEEISFGLPASHLVHRKQQAHSERDKRKLLHEAACGDSKVK